MTGMFDCVSVVVRHTLVQGLTPDRMRGRVSAISGMFIGASNELGGFESGTVARLFSPVIAVVSGGIGTLFVVGDTELEGKKALRAIRAGLHYATSRGLEDASARADTSPDHDATNHGTRPSHDGGERVIDLAQLDEHPNLLDDVITRLDAELWRRTLPDPFAHRDPRRRGGWWHGRLRGDGPFA